MAQSVDKQLELEDEKNHSPLCLPQLDANTCKALQAGEGCWQA